MHIHRKTFNRMLLSTLVGSLAGPIDAIAAAKQNYLLDPNRLRAPLVPPKAKSLTGDCAGNVTYWEHENPGKPLVLYFHGFGGDHLAAMPPEYPLLDAAHVICVDRPGYAGTDLDWRIDGVLYAPPPEQPDTHASPSPGARETARIAFDLLKVINGQGRWNVCVIGTSGGGPAALAFASLYPQRTRSLIFASGRYLSMVVRGLRLQHLSARLR
jgi:pimeloyl-ACP methyl ester carboxylesterase